MKTQEKLIEGTIQIIKNYESELSIDGAELEKRVMGSLEDVITLLIELFTKQEEIIQEKHKERFVTDDYENGVRDFTSVLLVWLLPYHNEWKTCRNYKELLKKRHVGYGYFHLINREYFKIPEDKPKRVELEYEKVLYLSLVEFYDNFYGSFADNEEAIELLCKYYPWEAADEMKEHEEKLASALYPHISNAGTPSDLGYAYHGIELIEKYIGNLPLEVVDALLKEYALYYILNQKVYRHQIHAIIENAGYKQEHKKLIKFWYLDSLLVADLIDRYLFEKLRLDEIEVEAHNNYYDYRLQDDKLQVLDTPDAYWNNDSFGERVLFLEEHPFISIQLQREQIEIRKHGVTGKAVYLNYEYADWWLDVYKDANLKKNLNNLVMESTESNEEQPHNQMLFSLAYLNNYRGLQNQIIDFDHRYLLDKENEWVAKRKDNVNRIPHLYGKSVYSFSCIVGKNGTGKTSILDFLREAFFKLLKLIDEGWIPCENGYVCRAAYEDYELLEPEAEFLMVFTMGSKPYFLTNIQGIAGDEIVPYHKGAYHSVEELSKVAYFSNQLRSNRTELLWDREEKISYDEKEQKKLSISKVNNDFRMADYSEEKSFVEKRKAMELMRNQETNNKHFVNKEICYQLSFLQKCSNDKLCEYLDIKKERVFQVVSQLKREDGVAFSLESWKTERELMERLKGFILCSDATIKHFSAGQYAKFSFLAKLFWFLESSTAEIEQYNEWAGNAPFGVENILLNDETALIFIDEGEVYYHPEWQRSYVKDLLEIINSRPRKVQIIVTTNSPFIISDIQSEDITYLADDEKNVETSRRKIDLTLGQNIHKLLIDNFFMDYTIGEYARELIENIMLCLQDNQELERMNIYFDDIPNYYDAFNLLIEQIGEPVYRYQLKRLLEESTFAQTDVEKQIRELEEQKRKLQQEIDQLRGNSND